jgi:predicted dehydrogenase
VPQRDDPIGGKRSNVTTEDQGSLLLQYGNGAMGYLCGSYVFTGRGYDQRVEVYGSEGGLMYDQQRPYELQLWLPEEQMAQFIVIRRGGAADRPYHTVLVPERLHGKDGTGPGSIVEAFAMSLQAGPSDLVPSFEDGLRVQEVLEASARAAASRAWVDLPL